MFRNLKFAACALPAFGAMALMPTTAAQAATVIYSTSSSQLCVGATGCGVLSQTIGGSVILTFAPIASSSVNASPSTFGSFGELIVSCVGGGTACGSQSLAGLNLYINIAQSAPTAGNGSIAGGVITGSISGTASSALISWASSSTSIGNVSYSVLNTPLGLVPASVNSGTTSIQAAIMDNTRAVPEPATWLSMMLGMGALGFTMRKRSVVSPKMRYVMG